ncbi:MAG: hypothetical protein HY690_16880 [Chloroflexi bacterium]|nr:hypothetical protein [Chloroflexota bacterium]
MKHVCQRTLLVSTLLLMAACAPPAPAPTAAPAKPAPTAAPAAQPAATAQPAAKPAATAAPVAKPTAQPAATAVPKPAVSFAGKTFKVIAGGAPGGGFDTWARLIARHMPRYLPGNPTMIVENVPAATGVVAANTIYNTAEKDGTVFGTFSASLILRQLVGDKDLQADMSKFSWLGVAEGNTPTCAVRSELGIKTYRELLQSKREVVIGATGVGGSTYNFPKALNVATGSTFKIVVGYQGTTNIRAAMERGEADGFCNEWESVKSTSPEWLKGSPPFIYVLVQQGPKKHPDLQEVPLGEEFATTEEMKQLLRVVNVPLAFFKSFVAPPGVPAAEMATIRQAYAAVFKDRSFEEEAHKVQAEPGYQPPEEVLKTVKDLLSAPPQVVEAVKKVINP